MPDINKLPTFKFWCQKVLPLVYDDSLSYYEVLEKVVEYLNNMIKDFNGMTDGFKELQKELAEVQKWIHDFDPCFLKKWVEEFISTMIFVEISDAGYIVYYIPETWKDITFNTTGLDIILKDYPEYGRLVLSY